MEEGVIELKKHKGKSGNVKIMSKNDTYQRNLKQNQSFYRT